MSQANEGRAALPSIFSRDLALLLLTEFSLMTCFYLLVSVVPLYAAHGGEASLRAGLATGVMMVSTVLAELAAPRLLARLGYRIVLITGALLLGLPALVLMASSALPLVLGVCLLRGIGLGVVVVSGSALAAELVPVERRSEGLGLYGVAADVPSVLGLSLGVWVSQHAGFDPVFLSSAAVALAAAAAASGLHGQRGRATASGRAPDASVLRRRAGVLRGMRADGLDRPVAVFGATTLAAGVVVTFLPLAVPSRSGSLAAAALLSYSAAAPLTCWLAGRYGDRHGSGSLLVPVIAVSAVGLAGLVAVHNPAAVIIGMTLFGAGFGAAQNVTIALMMGRVPPTDFGRASALWNLAYDAGIGTGAVGFGLLAQAVGYRAGFAVTTAVLLAALLPAWRDQAGTRVPSALVQPRSGNDNAVAPGRRN